MSTESLTNQNMPINVKLLVIGAASVGKSSLLLRFADRRWIPENEAVATVGVDTWVYKLHVKGKNVNLTIWDTAGQERFRAITSSYYRGTQGILLVYDITDRGSYEAIPWWFAERSRYVPERTVKIVVGNKADKEYARQVSTEEAAAYAASMGCLFVETSAKAAVGARRAFYDVLDRIAETPAEPVLWAVQEPRKILLPKSSTPAPEPVAQTEMANGRIRRILESSES
ncbi:ras-domain-containing protein [Russula earlei]|uniref:Ras-domain-containing protein n=1 Tax=Russula earlei TaxID=71964 RepID=A0ACC0U5S7_9AGAM|nr:ras-domain-containing protein [Russula earlei]